MNGFLFSAPKYMNGVGFEMSGRTSVPKWPLGYFPTPLRHAHPRHWDYFKRTSNSTWLIRLFLLRFAVSRFSVSWLIFLTWTSIISYRTVSRSNEKYPKLISIARSFVSTWFFTMHSGEKETEDRIWIEPPRDKTNKIAIAPSEDSDQPVHPPSLTRVFTVRMKKAWVLSYPLIEQRRLWVFAGGTCHSVYFVTRWLNWQLSRSTIRSESSLFA